MTRVDSDRIVVRDWDRTRFHGRVRQKEAQGYTPRLESYTVMPDIDPQTGELSNVFVIEMDIPEAA